LIIGTFASAIVLAIPVGAVMVSIAVSRGLPVDQDSDLMDWCLQTYVLITTVGMLAMLVVGMVASRATTRGRVWRVLACIGFFCMPLVGIAAGTLMLNATL
jgi:hypothetical protein